MGWLGNGVKRLENTVNNDVVRPALHLGSQAENTVAAAGAGIGGLVRAGAGAVTHDPIAEQNAINQTNRAINNRLALNRAFLTAGQAQQGGTALIRPTLSAAGRIAPYAIGGLGSGIIKPALAFGGVNATGTALQGDFKKGDLAKSFALGAAPVGVGKAIGAGVRGTPTVAKAVQKYDQAQNQIGAIGKNVSGEGKSLPVIKGGNGLPSVPLKNFNKTEIDLHGNALGAVGQSHFHGIADDAIPLSSKSDLNKIGVLSQASKSQAVRTDANRFMYGLSDRVGSGIKNPQARTAHRIEYFKNLSTDLRSAGTPEGAHIQAEISKITGTKPTPSTPPIGSIGKNVSKEELAMGKALGMAPKDVARAKAESQAPSLTSVPKQAGTVEKVPFSMRPRPTKNPMTPGPLDGAIKIPQVLPGDAAQAHLNADYVAGHIKSVGAAADKAVSSLSTKDQKLMQSIQTKGVAKVAVKADNPTAFRAAEKTLRNYYDTRIAYDHAQGIATPYRQNYLRDLIPPPDSAKTFEARGGNLTPGYTQAKTAPGATPVLEGLRKDIAGSSFNHAKLTYAQGMEQAFPGQINRGAPLVGPEGVTQQLLTPYGNELFATKGLAKDINKRAASSKAEGALGKYDTLNAVAKYIKLGGGAFHALTESGNFIGQQLSSGKLFREPSASAKVFKTFFSDKALKSETSKMAQSGALENAQRSGLTWTPEAIKADITVTPHGKLSTYTGIKALHDATFRREIPYMKLKTFEQKTQGLDYNNPEDLAKMRTIAKSVNAEFGGINRAVEGVSPQNAKRWSRILLASDFTESKITTLKNAISKGGEEGKLAREVVAGKALLFGGLAAGGAVIGGELKGKNTNDKIASLTGKILDPSFNFGSYKVSLPSTHVSEFTKPFKSFGNSGTDKFSGLKHYATGRLAAVPSEVNQLVNNQDYKGAKIYGGTKKKPISGGQAALNVASGVVPIPGSQGIAAATGQQSPAAAAANIIGLRAYKPTPTKAEQAKSRAASKNMRTETQAKGAQHQGQTIEPVLDNAGNKRFVYSTSGGAVKTTANLSTAQHAIQIDSFKNSDAQSELTKDRYYYKDSIGGVHYKSIDAYNKSLATAKARATKASAKKSSVRKARKVSTKSLTSHFKTAGNNKIAKPKGVKVAKVKAPSFKAPKTNKLAVNKIPSNYLSKKLA